MNKENIQHKADQAFEILEEPSEISSGKNFYDQIYSKLSYPKRESAAVKYSLLIILILFGLFSGIYLGINVNNRKGNSAQQYISNDNTSLEKIILGKDFQ